MATKVDLKNVSFSFDVKTNPKGRIIISEKKVPFDTEYDVISPQNNIKRFIFTHSTGPEFDPKTEWIYKSEDGIVLAVCNDPYMVKIAAENYLKSKLKK